MRANLFPCGFKGAGDTVWGLRNAAKAKFCLTPRVGTTFCVHPKEGEARDGEYQELLRMLGRERSSCLRGIDDEGMRARLGRLCMLSDEVAALKREAGSICRNRIWPLNLMTWMLARVRLATARAKLRKCKRESTPVRGALLVQGPKNSTDPSAGTSDGDL